LLTLLSFEESVHAPGFLGNSNGHREVSSNSKTTIPQGCHQKAGSSFLGREDGLGIERCFFRFPVYRILQEITVANDSEQTWFVLGFRTRVRIGMAARPCQQSRSDKVTRVWRPMFLSYTLL
jgi:hypothetical protein